MTTTHTTGAPTIAGGAPATPAPRVVGLPKAQRDTLTKITWPEVVPGVLLEIAGEAGGRG